MKKRCSKCREIKSLEAFSSFTRSKDGLTAWCKTCSQKWNAKYYLINREKILKQQKDYYAINLQARKRKFKRQDIWTLQKYKTDIPFHIERSLKHRLRGALSQSNKDKVSNATKKLGCTISNLIIHLESQFKPGMSWENHSRHGWHIDHIKPLSSFDLREPAQLAEACHYKNLQPLWAKENLSKQKIRNRKGFWNDSHNL